jgi:Right handed beta helix region
VQNVRWNGIKIDSETGVQRLTVRSCVLRNIWQRAIKGVKVPESGLERLRPKGCRVEYCLFMNDRPKRFEDDPTDTAQSYDGNYIGGIDVMYASGWTIADNVFLGIRGRSGSARGAVFLWMDSRDCVVERNVVVDCDSGICLGNAFKPPEIAIHCTGIVVRNNFVTRAPEGGIVAAYTRDCAILHNTVHEPASRFGRLIRLLNDDDGLRVENNLLSGPGPLVETSSRVTLRNNLSRDMTAVFVAPDKGNLRLTAAASAAIDQAEPLAEVKSDIDKNARDSHPDLGAHEFVAPAKQATPVGRPSR